MTKTLFDEYVSDPLNMRAFQQERAIFQVTSLIEDTMEREGISRAALAKRLGTQKSRVTELLDGEGNKTVRTIADVFAVLGYEYHGHIRPICRQQGSTAVIADDPALAWATEEEFNAIVTSPIVAKIA